MPLDSPSFLIELTYMYTQPRSFIQSRIQGWNPLVLCRCPSSVCRSPIWVDFRPLTLRQTLRRSISRGSAYRLANGGAIGSLLTVIISVCRRLKPLFRLTLSTEMAVFPASEASL
ncbi:hypothetical protein [Planktothrix sp. FACHB-1355]|uniref:hypothetical protein n=1 Tax=Planktothrix sp. FACHB-1355 TaxID=2692854 RepID=UPI001A7E8497|nr:hypothetical protein [Planktothrix sp. FACHB-1355]